MTDRSQSGVLPAEERHVPTFEGRLFSDSEQHGLAGNWVRRAEVDVLLGEIKQLNQNLAEAIDHASKGWQRANEVARAEKDHCKDCCCARSWTALGITGYTGLSIPEHIQALRTQLDAVLKQQRDDCND